MDGRNLLLYLSLKYAGNYDKIYQAITKRETVEEEAVKEAVKQIKCHTLTIIDKEYPESLKRIPTPPLVLYYYGDISLLTSATPRLGVVGSRDCSLYGRRMTRSIVSEVAKSVIIVSGLARGIDAVAHRATIDAKGKTIAVLGGGIDVIYPRENAELFAAIKKNHLLISEYPGETKPEPSYFPLRNRLVAGFSDKLLVTEAYKNSGTNITVLYALKQGKDVMAIPYEADQASSCNKLIQDGAALVETADDVLYLMK
ncbi:MAG: DNA-processing protein DprA [Bacilli bacterium]|nr:DNA-processing protein DprA [Bacilli bacterium]